MPSARPRVLLRGGRRRFPLYFMSFPRSLLALLALPFATFAAEKLDRGVVAFPAKDGGVYVGWRLLAEDPKNLGFDVFRADSAGGTARKLNSAPITDSTNFVDRTAGADATKLLYSVKAVGGKTRVVDSGPTPV